ncbi:MAG: nuclear transport factor 2 family protein [Candidatus Eisenbacteria bacterium]
MAALPRSTASAGRRGILVFLAVFAAGCAHGNPPPAGAPARTLDVASVRRELVQRYEANRRAFLAKDFGAIMALRTNDFHSVTPDSAVHDSAEMALATQGLLNGIDRWIALTFDIDSLEVEGDLARTVVRQHADRMALRGDGLVHHVESWVTQRETWRNTAGAWKLYRVDGLRDQRRRIDGKPLEPSP